MKECHHNKDEKRYSHAAALGESYQPNTYNFVSPRFKCRELIIAMILPQHGFHKVCGCYLATSSFPCSPSPIGKMIIKMCLVEVLMLYGQIYDKSSTKIR